jgi:hypothetical protein
MCVNATSPVPPPRCDVLPMAWTASFRLLMPTFQPRKCGTVSATRPLAGVAMALALLTVRARNFHCDAGARLLTERHNAVVLPDSFVPHIPLSEPSPDASLLRRKGRSAF